MTPSHLFRFFFLPSPSPVMNSETDSHPLGILREKGQPLECIYFPCNKLLLDTIDARGVFVMKADCHVEMSSPVLELRSKLSHGLFCRRMQQRPVASYILSVSLPLLLSRSSVIDVYTGGEIVCSDRLVCCQQEMGGGETSVSRDRKKPCREKWPTMTGIK